METFPIIDSHIHLYPASELDTLAWCSRNHPLRGQHSIKEYRIATKGQQNLRGFVFIETDRKHHLESEKGWKQPLAEVEWIKRVAAGLPRPGEGHLQEHARLCLAVVPWAPVPLGVEALSRYVEQVKIVAGIVSDRVVGFRYLVQDKPLSTMLQPEFIEGLRWLGEQGYVFDLGIDQRSGGLWQLEEAIEMIAKAHQGVPEERKVVIVINHMCKPDMQIPKDDLHMHPSFQEWCTRVEVLASFPNTYMKISGAFSEMCPMPAQQEDMGFWTRLELLSDTGSHADNWISHVISCFGPQRVMFGSDWPVCNIGGGGNQVSWKNWRWIVKTYATSKLSNEDRAAIWGGTAAKVYRIVPRVHDPNLT